MAIPIVDRPFVPVSLMQHPINLLLKLKHYLLLQSLISTNRWPSQTQGSCRVGRRTTSVGLQGGPLWHLTPLKLHYFSTKASEHWQLIASIPTSKQFCSIIIETTHNSSHSNERDFLFQRKIYHFMFCFSEGKQLGLNHMSKIIIFFSWSKALFETQGMPPYVQYRLYSSSRIGSQVEV